jgi:hypothetical protein
MMIFRLRGPNAELEDFLPEETAKSLPEFRERHDGRWVLVRTVSELRRFKLEGEETRLNL